MQPNWMFDVCSHKLKNIFGSSSACVPEETLDDPVSDRKKIEVLKI